MRLVGSVIAAQHRVTVVVVTRHVVAVAHAVMDARRMAITVGIVGVMAVPAIAVHRGTFDAGALVIGGGGGGVMTTIGAIVIRSDVIAGPTGYFAFLIGRIRRKSPRTGVGRPLIDVVILRGRFGQPLIVRTGVAAGGAARIAGGRHVGLLARRE